MIDQKSVIDLALQSGVIDSADINSVHIPCGYIDDLAEFAYLVEENVCQLLEKLADELAVMDDGRGHNVLKMAVAIIREGSIPPARKPLTEPELHAIEPTWPNEWNYDDVLAFARAIERAHGIGEA